MEEISNLILIDSDMRRRAAISHLLSTNSIHVEPFENISELSSSWPRSGIILIHDEPNAINNLIEGMAQQGNWFPVIAFSEEPSPQRVVQAILDGAIDYIGWPISDGALTEKLRSSASRVNALGNARLREIMARARIERLTRREREVLGGVANGLSNRLIGEKLAISPRTVEIHRANMLNKLGAHHTSDAIRIAIEASLVN